MFAAGTAIAAALLLGIIASTWQSVRATLAKREALAAQAGETVQRQKAEANAQQALAAQAEETKLREQAEAAELAARQRAYASDMNVAAQALAGSNLGRAQDLLNRQRPQPGQKDLRGWEWRYLWQQTRSDALFTLCQKSEIVSLAASADGNWLAIGMVHRGGLSCMTCKPGRRWLISRPGKVMCAPPFPRRNPAGLRQCQRSGFGQKQDTLRLWNAATRQMVAEFPLDRECMGLAFAKDGRTLVTATGLGHITLWRIPEGTKLASYPSDQNQASIRPPTLLSLRISVWPRMARGRVRFA